MLDWFVVFVAVAVPSSVAVVALSFVVALALFILVDVVDAY